MRLAERECRARFASVSVARLATVGEAGAPHLVPITFELVDDELVFAVDQKPKRTTALQRLRNLRADARVAVLADRYDDDWSQLWWVRADGDATMLDDGPARTAAVERLARKYSQYRDDPPGGAAVSIAIRRWSGWSAR